MKYLLTVTVFMSMLFSVKAQENNVVRNGFIKKTPAQLYADSVDQVIFRQLVAYVQSESTDFRKLELNVDSLKRLSERHSLVNTNYNGEYAKANISYDNFLPSVYHKEPLEGLPYLLNAYVPGLVIDPNGSLIGKPDYLYNFDKVSENLLLKRGDAKPIAVEKEQVKYFCLKAGQEVYIFERVSIIDGNRYFQVLSKGSKFSFYKLIISKFINANQGTNGYIKAGNDYDEYQDIFTYYLVDQRRNEYVVFDIKKKSIRKSLPTESRVVEKYFKDHKGEKLTELYVAGLVDKLNITPDR